MKGSLRTHAPIDEAAAAGKAVILPDGWARAVAVWQWGHRVMVRVSGERGAVAFGEGCGETPCRDARDRGWCGHRAMATGERLAQASASAKVASERSSTEASKFFDSFCTIGSSISVGS